MFDVGFTELLLIGVVALVVIGPERLPDVARTVGLWIGKLQRFVRGVKTDIANELDSGELKKLIGDQREQIDELRKAVGSTRRELESTTKDAVRTARRKLGEIEQAAALTDDDATATPETTPSLEKSPGQGGTGSGGGRGVDAPTGGRPASFGATPADGANAAAKAIGGSIGAATPTVEAPGQEEGRAEGRASGQIDGQQVGDTSGSPNEPTPVDDAGLTVDRSGS